MKTLHQTDKFKLTLRSGQHWLRTKLKRHQPTGVHISASDARYLLTNKQSFDDAAVMDFGVAVFQSK